MLYIDSNVDISFHTSSENVVATTSASNEIDPIENQQSVVIITFDGSELSWQLLVHYSCTLHKPDEDVILLCVKKHHELCDQSITEQHNKLSNYDVISKRGYITKQRVKYNCLHASKDLIDDLIPDDSSFFDPNLSISTMNVILPAQLSTADHDMLWHNNDVIQDNLEEYANKLRKGQLWLYTQHNSLESVGYLVTVTHHHNNTAKFIIDSARRVMNVKYVLTYKCNNKIQEIDNNAKASKKKSKKHRLYFVKNFLKKSFSSRPAYNNNELWNETVKYLEDHCPISVMTIPLECDEDIEDEFISDNEDSSNNSEDSDA